MRVFVAGATGVVGRPLLADLLAAGHEVTAITRSAERAARLRAAGVEAAVADALNREAVSRAVAEARPEVVFHQLTAIPPDYNPRRHARDMAATDRLRAEGGPILVEAAARAGARRVVAQSIAFAYAPEGPPIKHEDARLHDDGPDAGWRRSVAALHTLERAVLRHEHLEGVVLRYGWFYGAGTFYGPDGQGAAMARRRMLPVVGGGEGIFSFVHPGDAAHAAVAALEGPPGIYNVVDDEPAPAREWIPIWAAAIGAPRPMRVPAAVARLVAGRRGVEAMTVQRGASNARARRELGWAPALTSWRQGFRSALG